MIDELVRDLAQAIRAERVRLAALETPGHPGAMNDPRFPGAPAHASISEEGWLIIGEEAWTAEEWASPQLRRHAAGLRPVGRPRLYPNKAARQRAYHERKKLQAKHAEYLALSSAA